MDGHASFLDLISQLKHELDKINEEVDIEIRKTRDLESSLLKIIDQENEALKEERKAMETCIIKKNHYLDLCTNCDALEKITSKLNEKVCLMEVAKAGLCKKIEDDRDAFISSCKQFQYALEEDFCKIEPSKKLDIHERTAFLEKEVQSFRDLYADDHQAKSRRVEELKRHSKDLQGQVHQEKLSNGRLLTEISHLKRTLQNMEKSNDIAWLSNNLQTLDEEKRQLQDCILSLQLQLSRSMPTYSRR